MSRGAGSRESGARRGFSPGSWLPTPGSFRRVDDPELRQLRRHVGALRRRLWLERAGALAARALVLGFGLAFVAAVAAWAAATPLAPAYYGGPVAGALALVLLASLFRYPSALDAARVADHRLVLRERIGTAVELAHGGAQGPIARRQLATAIDAAGWARRHWRGGRRSWRAAGLAAALGLMTAGVLLLTGLEDRLSAPIPRPSIWSLLPQHEPSAEQVPAPPVADEPAPRADRERMASTGETGGRTGAVGRALDDVRRARETGAIGSREAADRLARAEAELSRQTEASRAQREGLDRLGRALDQVAAGRPAAEEIQRGEYARAGQEIGNLGTESDQLSAQAKAQLAQALRSAAAESQASPELAARERRAADALAGRDYEAARRALQDLGDEVARRGRDVASQQELARAWDRVNEERRAQGQPSTAAQAQQAARAQQDQAGQGQRSSQQGRSQDAAGGQNAGSSAGSDSGGDEAGGEGPAGDGRGGEPTAQARGAAPSAQPVGEFRAGEPARRLDVQGRPVQVDVTPGQRNGRREGEADGGANEQPTDEVGAISTVSGEAPRPITAAAPSETNFVPSDRREVVRGYFGPQGER